MNKIRLQDLTPDVYYNTSRDFQFIGRLFDVVLNSVKVNAEMLYNNPFSDNSDERLLDLMTMTLGFKSRHNYNIKQLTALCSAFATILKNKGNIQAIDLTIQTLLNAEGIKEKFTVELNNTELNLYIPQSLTDTNLLKDVLVYILPAGMSCNIIKELRLTSNAATELNTSSSYKEYLQVNTGGMDKTSHPAKAIITRVEQAGIEEALIKDTAGFIANSDIWRPDTTNKEKK